MCLWVSVHIYILVMLYIPMNMCKWLEASVYKYVHMLQVDQPSIMRRIYGNPEIQMEVIHEWQRWWRSCVLTQNSFK